MDYGGRAITSESVAPGKENLLHKTDRLVNQAREASGTLKWLIQGERPSLKESSNPEPVLSPINQVSQNLERLSSSLLQLNLLIEELCQMLGAERKNQ
jgi:hypothetical protein